MRVVVLAYHSQNVSGHQYASNDHIALAADLAEIQRRALPLISLHQVAQALLSKNFSALPPIAVALSCDDGTLLDWEDFEHPDYGRQSSFDSIVTAHLRITGESPENMLTAFVIASKEARRAIDIGCYGGIPLSNDRWWREAAISRRVAIENHSWDHVHACVPVVAQQTQIKSDFRAVATLNDADRQIRQAADFIDRALTGTDHFTSLFAYPYGHVNDYLAKEYLPHHVEEHRVQAAFTTVPEMLTHDSDRYQLPRFVCGEAWNTPEEFSRILDELERHHH